MPDFLDRFGDQLDTAQQASSSAAKKHASAGWRSRVGRRSLLAAGATLALAAPVSVAVVSSWDPDLGRAGIDTPVSTDNSPVNPGATDSLAVLNRDQTAADRANAEPMIKAIGAGNQIDRVQTNAIRMVAPDWALVPAKVIRTGPSTTAPDQLCLTNGSTVTCSTATSVTASGLTLLSASEKGTELAGIVPDSVTRVRFAPHEGKAVEVPVRSNFYELTTAQTRTSPPSTLPNGVTVPGAPLPAAGSITWLDANDNKTGPAVQPIPE